MSDIELIIEAKARDVGNFVVGRAQPNMARRQVGPFVFFDHMGPVTFAADGGMDVPRSSSGCHPRARGARGVRRGIGGAPLDGPRYIEWNFVSSDKADIERAKRDWKEDRFPKVPGDSIEFIPLPE